MRKKIYSLLQINHTMKRIITYAAVAAAVLAACNKVEGPAESPRTFGTIELSISTLADGINPGRTRVSETENYEKAVRDVQVLVFGADGRINFYKNLGTETSGTISTTSGHKTVYAVVNGPDCAAVASLDELKNRTVDLAVNTIGEDGAFIMCGRAECEVEEPKPDGSAASTVCRISVSRLASRVVLKSVKNSLPDSYGEISIKSVLLANVVGEQNIAGNASSSVWYNKYGRKDEEPLVADHIINGDAYKASCEELTFKSVSEEVARGGSYTPAGPLCLYSYANSSRVNPSGFNTTFTACRSELVLTAEIQGKTYYYPVVLTKGLERNKSYDVALSISSLGSDDPGKPVDKGGMSVEIEIKDWEDGGSYSEDI